MLEASAFLPSAKATLNSSRRDRAIENVMALGDRLHPRCLLDPDHNRSLAYRSLPIIAELVEQLGVAMRTSERGEEWTAAWQLYCRWQSIMDPLLTDFVLIAREAGFIPSAPANTALGRALATEFETREGE